MNLSTLRAYPATLHSEEYPKVAACVAATDRGIITAALGDDSLTSIVIQHAIKRTAEFIRHYRITAYDPTHHAALVDFIRNGTDPRVDRPAGAQHVDGTIAQLHNSPASTPGQPTGHRKSGAGGKRVKTRKSA